MNILVNNRPVAVQTGLSVEYVRENRAFSGADDYTMAITFPLKGCAENIAVFGHAYRLDVSPEENTYDCEIIDRDFRIKGCLTLTEVTHEYVKGQFLQGRSAQNFKRNLSDIYINELELGEWPKASKNDGYPSYFWRQEFVAGKDTPTPIRCVAYPWIIDRSGRAQNDGYLHYNGFGEKIGWRWRDDLPNQLTFQPYFLDILKKICEKAGGYSLHIGKDVEQSLSRMIICNTLPASWGIKEFARALPHWTVSELLRYAEQLLGGQFDIDDVTKSITFTSNRDFITALPLVEIGNVLDEHTVEITTEEDSSCEYLGAKSVGYEIHENTAGKRNTAGWLVDSIKRRKLVTEYVTFSELLEAERTEENRYYTEATLPKTRRLYYAKDVDMYFAFCGYETEKVGYKYKTKMDLFPVGHFAPLNLLECDEAKEEKIKIVPATVQWAEENRGAMMVLPLGTYDEPEPQIDETTPGDFFLSEASGAVLTGTIQKELKAGAEGDTPEYYSTLIVGNTFPWGDVEKEEGSAPFPLTSEATVYPGRGVYYLPPEFSMRLNGNGNARLSYLKKINPCVKVTVKFLSDSIPNPRSEFLIRGKRYICESITATLKASGRSKLMKGVFYPIL